MPDLMLALSFKQPWGEAVVTGQKTMDVRNWRPRRLQYPVLLAIHAGQTWDRDAPAEINRIPEDGEYPWRWRDRMGGIIGVARLESVLPLRHRTFKEVATQHLNPIEWYRDGLYGWGFSEPMRFQRLIPCRGMLGLFEVPEIVVAQITEAMG